MIITSKYYRPFLVDQGYSMRLVQWTAWRKARPNVRGYGMIESQAWENLIRNVQPFTNEELEEYKKEEHNL